MQKLDTVKILKRALILLAGSALGCLFMIFMFTSIGGGVLFRLGVLSGLEEVDTSDTAHLEYYAVKPYISTADSVRVFLDPEMEGSLTAALDFLKFVKQNTELNYISLDIQDTDGVNSYLLSGDGELLPSLTDSESLGSFLTQLYLYNQTLPPKKRISAVSEADAGDGCYILAYRKYDASERSVGILDVSMIYPGTEECDPLFDIRSPILSGTRIRFGGSEGLAFFESVLDAVSGNFGMSKFYGVNQPEFYFLIENREESADS